MRVLKEFGNKKLAKINFIEYQEKCGILSICSFLNVPMMDLEINHHFPAKSKCPIEQFKKLIRKIY